MLVERNTLSTDIVEKNKNIGLIPVRLLKGYGLDLNNRLQPNWGEDQVATYDGLASSLVKGVVTERSEILSPETKLKGIDVWLGLCDVCNFGCKFCSARLDENKKSTDAKHWMTEEILEQSILSSVEAAISVGEKNIKLKYAGGEPTLRLGVQLMEKAQEKIRSVKDKYPDLEIDQVVLTNGTQLTQELAEKFKKWGMRVSVSLWGPNDEINDSERETVIAGSFSKAKEGMGFLIANGVQFSIHHVISPTNAIHFGEFIRTVGDPGYENFIGKDWDWGGKEKMPIPLTVQIKRPHTQEGIDEINENMNDIISGIRSGFSVSLELLYRGIYHDYLTSFDMLSPFEQNKAPACGSGFKYIAIGPQGQISGCHEILTFSQTYINTERGKENLLTLANLMYGEHRRPYGTELNYGNLSDENILAIGGHGGGGCTILSKLEHNNELGYSAGITQQIYTELFEEILALNYARRNLYSLFS